MNKEFLLNEAEKNICSKKVSVPFRRLEELEKIITMFEGQRPFKNRKNDRDGFLAAIIRMAETIDNCVSEDMKSFLMRIGSGIIETSSEASTNLKIFMTNKGKIWDGQHRYKWIVGFLHDMYKVPEQIMNSSLSGLKFSELAEKNPELAEAILNINFEFVIVDTDCVSTVAKLFYQMNNGCKKVSGKEGILALKAATTSVDLYKSLEFADEEYFPEKDTVCSFYSRTPIDSFVRNICYLSGISVSGAPELTIKSFLDKTDGMMKDDFYSMISGFGKIYEQIGYAGLLLKATNKYKGHTINALCKILYLIGKNIELEKGKEINGLVSLSNETVEEAGQLILLNQKVISEKIDEIVASGFKIGDSVKKTEMTDILVCELIKKVPSLGLHE